MPDLDALSVTTWLTNLSPPGAAADWPPPIRALETEMHEPLRDLGKALDKAAKHNLARLGQTLRAEPTRDDFQAVLAQLGAARLLRLLHWLSENDTPDCHAVTAALLGGGGASARALRAAVNAALRHNTLRHIFAPDRIAALQTACHAAFAEVP